MRQPDISHLSPEQIKAVAQFVQSCIDNGSWRNMYRCTFTEISHSPLSKGDMEACWNHCRDSNGASLHGYSIGSAKPLEDWGNDHIVVSSSGEL